MYLENNLCDELYNNNHVDLLKVLTSQMAISLENIRFLHDQVVEQRDRADAAEKYKTQLENFIDMICHEIRNPYVPAIQKERRRKKEERTSLLSVSLTNVASLQIERHLWQHRSDILQLGCDRQADPAQQREFIMFPRVFRGLFCAWYFSNEFHLKWSSCP